jgi:hypothetical protein
MVNWRIWKKILEEEARLHDCEVLQMMKMMFIPE